MARSKKKASRPVKSVSPSSIKIEDNLFEYILFETPKFDGNFDVWEIKMRAFLMFEGIEVWESVIDDSKMDKESMEYDAQATKTILDGLPDSVKRNLGKYTSAKDIWDRLHDLHAKGALTMTMSKEEPIIEVESEKVDLIKLQVKKEMKSLLSLRRSLTNARRNIMKKSYP